MACVDGGTFILGASDGQSDELVPAEVSVDTFYMDLREVTNDQFDACVQAGRCSRPMRYRDFMSPTQPRVAVSWNDAVACCEMNGKRLPTEAEWERAASGPGHTRFPWGDEPGGCEKAHVTDRRGHGCGRDTTLPVGSMPAGHFGLFDMAGNVHEWVADWYSPCLRGCEGECGDACFGRNPRGPCNGAASCPGRTKRSIRGGSWYWPEERARTTARRGAEPANTANHRFGFRCAGDLEPTGAVVESATPPAAPTPLPETVGPAPVEPVPSGVSALAADARAVLAAIPDEELELPDEHYYHSNEWRHDLLEPRLRGLGGVFMGVGADQCYTMAGMAGSELLLLVDFDPRIPRLHRIYEVLVTASSTGDDLVERFSPEAADASAALLRERLREGAETEAVVSQFARFREPWYEYLQRVRRLERDGRPFGWLADQAMYDHIRTLFEGGRVVARAGDVTGERTVRGMGRAAERLGLPVQVYYLSNAEQFFPYSESFIENVRSLPAGPRSVVVRTTRHARLPNAPADTWHYVVQDLLDFRERLDTGVYLRSTSLIWDLVSSRPSVIGRTGISNITSAVPMREVEREERRPRSDE
jgi:formylglycine-generating enzyme required for sulfatase activity